MLLFYSVSVFVNLVPTVSVGMPAVTLCVIQLQQKIKETGVKFILDERHTCVKKTHRFYQLLFSADGRRRGAAHQQIPEIF